MTDKYDDYETRYERSDKWSTNLDFMPYNWPTKDVEYWLSIGLMYREKIPFMRAEVYKWVRKKK